MYHVIQLDYTVAKNDPEGSVSIFKRQSKTGTYKHDCEVGFDWFNTAERTDRLVARGMRAGVKNFTTFSMVMKEDTAAPSYRHTHQYSFVFAVSCWC